MAAVTICSDFGAPQNKVCHCFPIYFPWSDGTWCHDLRFLNVEFKPTFSLSTFTFIKGLFSSSSLLPKGWCHLHIWGYWYFSWQSWFQLVLLPAQSFLWCTLHISCQMSPMGQNCPQLSSTALGRCRCWLTGVLWCFTAQNRLVQVLKMRFFWEDLRQWISPIRAMQGLLIPCICEVDKNK